MDADNPAALCAAPALLFGFYESTQTVRFYIFEVFYHTHGIPCPVALIQLLQAQAGKPVALITKFGLVLLYRLAVFDDAFQAGGRFVNIFPEATGAVPLFPEVSHADIAIHAAGGN
jgi:hypothetical protein